MKDAHLGFYKCFLLVIITSLFACHRVNNDVVALVNHYPISSSEFKYWMLLQRAEVYNYYYEEYGIIDSDKFWEQKINQKSPLEMLKDLALQKAVRCKIQQILALEKGIVDQIDFDRIISKMEDENQRRKEKVEKGEVIYGALKFTQRTFFAHEFDKMLMSLKVELLKSELKPSEKDLELLIKNKEYPLKDNYGFYQMQYVEENYDQYIDGQVGNAHIEVNTKIWDDIKPIFN